MAAICVVGAGRMGSALARAFRRYRGDDQTLAAIAAHYSAFQHLLEVSAERGLNRVVPDAFDTIFKAAIAAGHRQNDFAALARFMR
jgi:3-hydroxyisobutyrate dehydrogenase-like beta-hydroxyacid dehydrogenase